MNNDSTFEKLKHLKTLENTRMIYDLMTEINLRVDGYNSYNGSGGLKARIDSRDSLKQKIDELVKGALNGEDVLYQNALSGHLRFWKQYYNSEKYTSMSNDIANSYAVFKAADTIAENMSEDDLPYLYEDLCISAAEMMNCEMCYILYGSDEDEIQIVSRSGYLIHEGRIMQDPSFLDILKLSQNEAIINGINLVYGKDINPQSESSIDKTYDYLIYEFPFHIDGKSKNGVLNLKKFFMVFCKINKDNPLSGKTSEDIIFESSKKILFLRHKIMSILERDYGVLLNFRYDCHYIKRIYDKKTDSLRILHISDIHAEDNSAWAINSNTFKKTDNMLDNLFNIMKNKGDNENVLAFELNKDDNRRSIELMVITGDVIQADKSAYIAQRKYNHTAEYIGHLVIKLWGEDHHSNIKRLPHDWKRRVIITTGNHDYMTMNELVSQTKERQTRYGEPSSTSGGTMTKFTYYVEFLQKFIDAPIDRLLRDDLNEVRYYKNFGFKTIVVNTASAANALQNNKVGANTDIVRHLLESSIWKDSEGIIRACLLHHGPGCKIGYIDDIYRERKLFPKTGTDHESPDNDFREKFKVLYSNFKVISNEIYKNSGKLDKIDIYDKFLNAYNHLSDYINEQMSSSFEEEQNEEIKEIKKAWINLYYESNIYPIMRDLFDYLSKIKNGQIEHDDRDEFISQSISKITNNVLMSQLDQNKHNKLIDLIIKQTPGRKVAFLSGHVHVSNDIKNITESDDYLNLVVGKALDRISVIELNNSTDMWNRWTAQYSDG